MLSRKQNCSIVSERSSRKDASTTWSTAFTVHLPGRAQKKSMQGRAALVVLKWRTNSHAPYIALPEPGAIHPDVFYQRSWRRCAVLRDFFGLTLYMPPGCGTL